MIEIQSLVKSYGASAGRRAVNDVTFSVEAGKVVTLLGASGCGKTTTLRCIAGLVSPDSGRIRLGEKEVYNSSTRLNLAPDQRDIGMVFQSYAIWPHMTVAENVAFPLRCRRMDRAAISKKVATSLELVGLGHLGDRLAPNLSGGQQQRVALARAIVAEPDVLLLDEPLSNLDAKLRDDMRGELRSLQRRLGITMCFVTHDQVEALGLADTVVLMRDGEIVETGSPRQLYDFPADPYTAVFLGASNLWRSSLERVNEHEAVLANEFGRFTASHAQSSMINGSTVDLFFRRHNVRLCAPENAGDINVATAVIREVAFLGETLQVTVEKHGLVATIAIDPLLAPALSVGDEVHFTPTHSLIFDADADARAAVAAVRSDMLSEEPVNSR